MNKILVVAHQEQSSAGRIGRLLQRRGYHLEMCYSGCGEALPTDLAPYGGVIVLGGPASANDDGKLNYIGQELRWIEQPLRRAIPFLGICLGAQLLARNLGGHVGPHPGGWHEIGYYEITRTADRCDIFADRQYFYQWHGEGITLPAGITSLAASKYFPQQAFCYGENAYGLQFHPEVTFEILDSWCQNSAHRMVLPGAQSRQRQSIGSQRFDAGIDRWAARFLDHWLERPAARQSLLRSAPADTPNLTAGLSQGRDAL